MTPITVYKRNHWGEVVWRYDGVIVERSDQHVLLEAYFNRDDRDDGYFVWRRGDRFLEWFYGDRWYNVFKIHDVDDGRIKGWYCNVTRPAVISDSQVYADDLALDVFVYPSGEVLLLDEDEFAALDLPESDRRAALAAVDQIRAAAAGGAPPFDR